MWILSIRIFPLSSLSGPCYPDDARMDHAPMSYNGPHREPALANNKWDYPSRPMNHRHFNPCRPPSKGPFPVTNRGVCHLALCLLTKSKFLFFQGFAN